MMRYRILRKDTQEQLSTISLAGQQTFYALLHSHTGLTREEGDPFLERGPIEDDEYKFSVEKEEEVYACDSDDD
jgi:hypothetical protein